MSAYDIPDSDPSQHIYFADGYITPLPWQLPHQTTRVYEMPVPLGVNDEAMYGVQPMPALWTIPTSAMLNIEAPDVHIAISPADPFPVAPADDPRYTNLIAPIATDGY